MEHLCSFLRHHHFQRNQSLIHVNLAKKFHARSDELRSKPLEDHRRRLVVFLVHDEHPKNPIKKISYFTLHAISRTRVTDNN